MCLFCDIVEGKVPSEKIYENELVYVFKDIHPVAPVHILVIPKKHFDSAADLKDSDSDIITALSLAVRDVAKQVGVDKTGYRVLTNVGEDGGQTVKHLHYHILGGKKLPTMKPMQKMK